MNKDLPPHHNATEPSGDADAPRAGRAARLQAEDAADAMARPQRWKALDMSAAETTAGEPRGVRPRTLLLAVAVLALVAGTGFIWFPKVSSLWRKGPDAAPTLVIGPSPAAPRAATDVTGLDARVAALEGRTTADTAAKAAPNGDTPAGPAGDTPGNQARQMAALTARVAALEGALGNASHLDELKRRVDALEDKSAAASSVLALSDRVTTLETTSRNAVAEQTVRVALVMAIAQWRDALAEGRPFALELENVKALADRATQSLPMLDDKRFVPLAPAGIATTAELKERFDDTASQVLRAAAVPGGFEGFWGRALERILSIVTIRRADGVVAGNDPSAILARTGAFLKDGNLPAAVTEMEQLKDSPAAAAQTWLDEARARVAAERAVADATNKAVSLLAVPTNPVPPSAE
jgi:uroporphyrinogen-III synthase